MRATAAAAAHAARSGTLPPGFTVVLRASVRRLAGGRVLIGGSPLRALRLAEAIPQRVVVTDAATDRLAQRLLSANLADPIDLAPVDPDRLTVVVPVRDRAVQLDRCLSALAGLRLLVVDDASHEPEAVRRVAERHGAVLIAREINVGPAGARNAGLDQVETPLVAFVDSDVTVGPMALARLAGHTADPRVALVGPLVRGHVRGPAPRWFERYDAAASSLALGPRPCSVRPGAAVAWLPGACLVGRTDALRAHGGFDEALRVGEDVDLVWRLTAAGHEVRYDPTEVALHDVRGSIAGWLGRKVAYGSGGALLAQRHGAAVAPAVVSPAIAAAAAALLARRPWSIPLAVGVTAWTAVSLRAALPEVEGRTAAAARLGLEGMAWGVRQESALLLRHWWPAAAAGAALSSDVRRMVATALVVDAVVQMTVERHQLAQGVAVGWLSRRLDDVAYGAGLWLGAARARSTACLRPRILGGTSAARRRS